VESYGANTRATRRARRANCLGQSERCLDRPKDARSSPIHHRRNADARHRRSQYRLSEPRQGFGGHQYLDRNTWIANATENRIPRLLHANSISDRTGLAITSITFFNAPWLIFKPENTRQEEFLVRGENATRVPMMITKSSIFSAVHEKFTVLGVPFGLDHFQLTLIVPKDPKGLRAIEAELGAEVLTAAVKAKSTRIELHLPRFKITPATLALRELLISMGLKTAFDGNGKADFGRLSKTPLYVDQIYDSAQFEVDEHGLSGAAASAVAITALGDPSSLPTDSVFRVDRPFLFALQHRETSACIFLGRVVDPAPAK
jgi:serpin B